MVRSSGLFTGSRPNVCRQTVLTAYYDLAFSPASYDVVAFLLAAENWRRENGGGPLRIEILPGPNDGFRCDRFWPYTIPERQQMLDKVVLPMCSMLPDSEVVAPGNNRPWKAPGLSMGYNEPCYGLALQVQMLARGIRPLRPWSGVDLIRKPIVTITLREADHWPERNSNVPEWLAAAGEIERQGYAVTIIRDTLRAGSDYIDNRPIKHSVHAARNLMARAQVYRAAVCNLFVNNGPAWFALALDAPVLMLKPTVENLMPTCSAEYFRACGIQNQIPWAPDHQRLVWAEDTTENILSAFCGFMGQDVRRHRHA